MPDVPARPAAPALLPPNQMPRRGRIGSERSRIAMIHALAHIEFVAIDLAFDLIGRFGSEFPAAFTGEWMQVGAEEAMHFALLDRRLRQMGSHYGVLPAHDGLWDAARETAGEALARLARARHHARDRGAVRRRRRCCDEPYPAPDCRGRDSACRGRDGVVQLGDEPKRTSRARSLSNACETAFSWVPEAAFQRLGASTGRFNRRFLRGACKLSGDLQSAFPAGAASVAKHTTREAPRDIVSG